MTNILPNSCKYVLGLFSPKLGTPANMERLSARDSASSNNNAPHRDILRIKNFKSQSIEYAKVCSTTTANNMGHDASTKIRVNSIPDPISWPSILIMTNKVASK